MEDKLLIINIISSRKDNPRIYLGEFSHKTGEGEGYYGQNLNEVVDHVKSNLESFPKYRHRIISQKNKDNPFEVELNKKDLSFIVKEVSKYFSNIILD